MRKHNQDEQNLQVNSRDRKKVDRYEICDVVFQECPPRRRRRFVRTDSVLLYRRFCDFDAQLTQLPNDTRRAPVRIRARQSANQILDFLAHSRSAGRTMPAEACPMLTKPSSLPRDNRQGPHKFNHGTPSWPVPGQPGRQNSVFRPNSQAVYSIVDRRSIDAAAQQLPAAERAAT